MTQCYSATGEAKIKGTVEFLKHMLENNSKFLVFGHHKCMLDGIEEFVKEKSIDYIRIDG
jgi:SNF2 family DNA or RNA helicase